jgi:hypothetical protein
MVYRREEEGNKLALAHEAAERFAAQQLRKEALAVEARAVTQAQELEERRRQLEEEEFVKEACAKMEEQWTGYSVSLAVLAGEFEQDLWRTLADPSTSMPANIKDEALRKAKAVLRARALKAARQKVGGTSWRSVPPVVTEVASHQVCSRPARACLCVFVVQAINLFRATRPPKA